MDSFLIYTQTILGRPRLASPDHTCTTLLRATMSSGLLAYFTGLSTTKKVAGAGALAVAVYLMRPAAKPAKVVTTASASAAGGVDSMGRPRVTKKGSIYNDLMARLKQIMKIIFPKAFSREMLHLVGLSALLIGRTIICMSDHNVCALFSAA
jgi:hypothetical protein